MNIKTLIATTAIAFSTAAMAADTPTSLAGVDMVDAAQAKALADAGALMIDTRVAMEYAEGHIKGALSIPYKEKSAKAADFNKAEDSFPLAAKVADKNTKVVMYCNGPSCWKSYKAAKVAHDDGYKSVYWFRTGYPAWKAAGHPVE